MRGYLAPLLLAGMAPVAVAQEFPLHVMRFEGAERYPQEALGALTGLRVGEAVNPQHFNEGARRLAEPGSAAGEPLNALYVNEYLKEAFGVLDGATGVSQQFAPRGESNVVDILVTFRK